MKIITREDLFCNVVSFWFYKETSPGKVTVAKPLNLVFDEYDECFMLPEPTFTVSRSQAQELCQTLLDSLVQMGYRPNNDKLAGKVEAQDKHMADLQKIVDVFLKGIK